MSDKIFKNFADAVTFEKHELLNINNHTSRYSEENPKFILYIY